MVYMVTFTINLPPMLVYIPYMDPMGYTTILTTENIRVAFEGYYAAVLHWSS